MTIPLNPPARQIVKREPKHWNGTQISGRRRSFFADPDPNVGPFVVRLMIGLIFSWRLNSHGDLATTRAFGGHEWGDAVTVAWTPEFSDLSFGTRREFESIQGFFIVIKCFTYSEWEKSNRFTGIFGEFWIGKVVYSIEFLLVFFLFTSRFYVWVIGTE